MLVEFKVNNAPEAYAAIADVAGVNAAEVGEALRAGSRLERIGLVENLISEHNITDLADLMKVSEKLPPVLMREYRDQSELMAVFTRPAAAARWRPATSASLPTMCRCWCACCARPSPQGGGRQRAAVRPARHRQDRAGQGGGAGRRAGAVRGRIRRPRRQQPVRPRPLPLLQIAQVFLKGSAAGGAAVRRGGRRVPAISSDAAS
jgi:hypothetical protein